MSFREEFSAVRQNYCDALRAKYPAMSDSELELAFVKMMLTQANEAAKDPEWRRKAGLA